MRPLLMDLSKPTKSLLYSPEPRTEVYCFRHLGLLYNASSIHLKHHKAQKLSLDEAIFKLETLDNFLKETVQNVMSILETPCKPSGTMGNVSSQTLSSVRMILQGLKALKRLLKELSPIYKIDLYTCLTVQLSRKFTCNGSLQRAVSNFTTVCTESRQHRV